MNRREFLKGTAWMGTLAFAAGCVDTRIFGGTSGAPMQGWAAAPVKGPVKVGVVGLGNRGRSAIRRLVKIPGIEVAALCDAVEGRVDAQVEVVKAAGRPVPRRYCGPEAYKAMCDSELDAVYIVTNWQMHVPVALRAMACGKHALVEVPSAPTVDDCWALVEESERTKRHCMQLENCCYGEMEMLMLNLARTGMLGEIVHGTGGYIHDLRNIYRRTKKDSLAEGLGDHLNRDLWRLKYNSEHRGNQYPTHGLGPICNAMDINRGDRMEYLVSLESDQFNWEAYAKARHPDDWRAKLKVAMGDVNTTLVRTAKGRSITIVHDVSCPRPYSRINLLAGTKGSFSDYPYSVGWEEKPGAEIHAFFDAERAEKVREEYRHPIWKQVGELAKAVGGHGGMDFIMDLRWSYCLQNGLPLDTDVYDLAAWSSICELSERSVARRSNSIDMPDFTRGAWRTAKRAPFDAFDMTKVELPPMPPPEATEKKSA